MDVVVAGDGMDLGLLAEAAEGAGKDDAVVILVKRCAAKLFRTGHGFAETFAAEQCFPIHAVLRSDME